MKKYELIKKLNEDFNIYKYHDVWNRFNDYTKNIKQYIQEDYQEYACGLMIDFTEDIEEILTTTFITENLFTFIKENNKKDLLIFTHHPYYQKTLDNSWHDSISKNIDILKDNRIGIYVCHMALDFHPKYSTALYLAKEKGVDTYIRGISEFRGKNSISRNKTYFEELQNIGINIIGLGHYETECLAMSGLVKDYFGNLINSVTYFKDDYYK